MQQHQIAGMLPVPGAKDVFSAIQNPWDDERSVVVSLQTMQHQIAGMLPVPAGAALVPIYTTEKVYMSQYLNSK